MPEPSQGELCPLCGTKCHGVRNPLDTHTAEAAESRLSGSGAAVETKDLGRSVLRDACLRPCLFAPDLMSGARR